MNAKRGTHLAGLALSLCATACTGSISNEGGGPTPSRPPLPGDVPSTSLPPKPEECSTPLPLPRRLRGLNSLQYQRSIAATFGADAVIENNPFVVSDRSAGFSTNTELRRFDFRSTKTVMDNAAAMAQKAIPTLRTRFACLAASNPDEACVAAFVHSMGREIYREPLEDVGAQRLITLFEVGRKRAGVDRAIALTVRAMLSSPHFLFRKELGAATSEGSGHRLTAYETASALSYSLTDAPPDAVLKQAADDNALTTLQQVRAQVTRLLANRDHGAQETGLNAFLRELFDGRDFVVTEKDKTAFPTFNQETRQAVFDDFNASMAAILNSSTPTFQALLTGETFVVRPQTAALLAWNDLKNLPAEGQSIKSPERVRVGVMTHPVMMATFAHENESNPVARGHFVSNKLLCITVPSPPAAVVFPEREAESNKTLRQTLEEIHSIEGCASCHSFMDPLGFPFEVFDAVGRLRRTDRGQPIDSSGQIVGTDDIDGPVDDARELMTRVANSRMAQTCFARTAFQYLAGVHDDDALDCRAAAFAKRFTEQQAADIPELFTQVLASEMFLIRQ